MVANGWRRQNMLGEFHFEPATGQLTEAGRLKVRWILTACPEQHRLIYVHTAERDEETSARIAAVQQLAAQIAPNDVPPVMPTSISDDGWPADQVDLIGRKFQSSTPATPLAGPDGRHGQQQQWQQQRKLAILRRRPIFPAAGWQIRQPRQILPNRKVRLQVCRAQGRSVERSRT